MFKDTVRQILCYVMFVRHSEMGLNYHVYLMQLDTTQGFFGLVDCSFIVPVKGSLQQSKLL